MKQKKLPRYLRALVKDLELQVDYLIGYSPSGLHWKQESHMRSLMIDEAVGSDYLPEEAKNKLLTILSTLVNLRNEEKQEQPYWNEKSVYKKRKPFYGEVDYKIDHRIKVWDAKEQKEYYI